MAYNIRVNQLLRGLNVSLEDFRFYMSNDEINPTTRVRVVTNGERTYNPKLMTTQELVELRESLLRDIEEKEISKLYKKLEEAKDEVRKIEESIIEIQVRHLEDESDFEFAEHLEEMEHNYIEEPGPWSLDWYEEESKMDELRDEYREDRKTKTAAEALEDLKRKMNNLNLQ
jgi:hypothetical protein